MNFGAFAGGVSRGVETGMKLSDFIKKGQEEQARKEVIQKATDEVEAERVKTAAEMAKSGVPAAETQAAPAVTPEATTTTAVTPEAQTVSQASPTANPDAAGAATAATPPAVSTQTPAAPVVQATPTAQAAPEATPQQAVAGAGVAGAPQPVQPPTEKAMGDDHIDRVNQNISKRMQEHMIKQGNIEGAEQWGKWGESTRGKRVMRAYARVTTAPDLDSMAQEGIKLYSMIDDGVDATGHKIIKRPDGSEVAMVTLKNKNTGKSYEMEMTRDSIMRMAQSANPQAMFEHDLKQKDAIETAKMAAKIKANQRSADFEDKDKLERNKQGYIASREGQKFNAGVDAKVESLRDAGYSDDEIRKMMPAIVGAGDHKKTTDPTERRAIIVTELVKDPSFKRKSKDEQEKIISDTMNLTYPDSKEKTAAPAVADKPVSYNKDLPVVYGKTTGKPYHVVNGKYVPIEGAVPAQPAAGGLPKK